MSIDIHSSGKVSLIYINRRRLLYFTIVGFTDESVIHTVVDDLNAVKHDVRADKLLIDTSKLGVLRKSDHDIIVEKMLPMFKEVGVNKIAMLKTTDVFGERSINDIVRAFGNDQVRVFDDIIFAEKWLLHSEVSTLSAC